MHWTARETDNLVLLLSPHIFPVVIAKCNHYLTKNSQFDNLSECIWLRPYLDCEVCFDSYCTKSFATNQIEQFHTSAYKAGV